MSCLTCSSHISMADCIENQKEQICKEGQNRCAALVLFVSGVDVFAKGCFNDISCEKYQIPGYCEQVTSGECELTCCEKSLCN